MDVSFSGFFQEVLSNPVLTITVLLTLGVIFVNGCSERDRHMYRDAVYEGPLRDLDERGI